MTTKKTKRTTLGYPEERVNRSVFSTNKIRIASGYLLDRLTEAAVGAYALITGPLWLKSIDGTLMVPEVAFMTLCSFILAGVWFMIAFIKGKFELS